MANKTGITWTDATFNPWIGCTKVSPACLHCYAEAQDQFRSWTPEGWGPGKPRKRTVAATWNQVRKWNRAAFDGRWLKCDACGNRELRKFEEPYGLDGCSNPECPGGAVDSTVTEIRPRVFAASLADWLDDEVPIVWLADLLRLIHDTPNLDWLLLTKRPQNFRPRLFDVWHDTPGIGADLYDWVKSWDRGTPPSNVWIGVTAENQTCYEQRVPDLLAIPARVRFLSMEPLLGPVQFGNASRRRDYLEVMGKPSLDGIHWIIAGGESGHEPRPTQLSWVKSIMEQCRHQNVPFLWKQWGEHNQHGDLVGKKAAGRLIDGALHHEFPTP